MSALRILSNSRERRVPNPERQRVVIYLDPAPADVLWQLASDLGNTIEDTAHGLLLASLDAVGQGCGAAQAKPPTPSFLGRLWLWRR